MRHVVEFDSDLNPCADERMLHQAEESTEKMFYRVIKQSERQLNDLWIHFFHCFRHIDGVTLDESIKQQFFEIDSLSSEKEEDNIQRACLSPLFEIEGDVAIGRTAKKAWDAVRYNKNNRLLSALVKEVISYAQRLPSGQASDDRPEDVSPDVELFVEGGVYNWCQQYMKRILTPSDEHALPAVVSRSLSPLPMTNQLDCIQGSLMFPRPQEHCREVNRSELSKLLSSSQPKLLRRRQTSPFL